MDCEIELEELRKKSEITILNPLERLIAVEQELLSCMAKIRDMEEEQKRIMEELAAAEKGWLEEKKELTGMIKEIIGEGESDCNCCPCDKHYNEALEKLSTISHAES